jgi:hypothetical protein
VYTHNAQRDCLTIVTDKNLSTYTFTQFHPNEVDSKYRMDCVLPQNAFTDTFNMNAGCACIGYTLQDHKMQVVTCSLHGLHKCDCSDAYTRCGVNAALEIVHKLMATFSHLLMAACLF